MHKFIFFLFLSASAVFADIAFGNPYKDRIDAIKQADIPAPGKYIHGRELLIGWAYGFTYQFNLNRNNVALAAEIFDRFVAKRSINKSDINLYFAACFVLASKFNEISISLRRLAEASYGDYSREDLKQAELYVCEALRWKTFYPTPAQYIYIFYESLANSRFMHWHNIDLVNYLLMQSLSLAEFYVYKEKCGMASWQIAINNIIDAVNKTEIEFGSKQFIFGHLDTLLKK